MTVSRLAKLGLGSFFLLLGLGHFISGGLAKTFLQLLSGFSAGLAAIMILVSHLRTTGRVQKGVIVALFSLILLTVTSLWSADPVESFSKLIFAVFVFTSLYLLLAQIDLQQFRDIIVVCALILSLPLVLASHFVSSGLNSLLPVLSLFILIAAILTDRVVTRSLLLGVAFYCLVLIGSRAEIVAGMFLIAALSARFLGAGNLYSRSAKWILVFCALGISFPILYVGVSDLLALEDQYRGLGSGFTGRTDAWIYALKGIAEHPWFGIGYAMQPIFYDGATYSRFGEQYNLSSAHNGFLSLFLELGVIIGAIISSITILLIIKAFKISSVIGRDIYFRVGAVSVMYLIFIMFERFYLNVGNVLSPAVFALLVQVSRYGLSGFEARALAQHTRRS